MRFHLSKKILLLACSVSLSFLPATFAVEDRPENDACPSVNGPSVFGVRPNAPFLYAIPASGKRPMTYAVQGLPEGLDIDSQTGYIGG